MTLSAVESEQRVTESVGIRLHLPKSRADYRKEIQRADDDGAGNPDTFEPLVTLPGDQTEYLDLSVAPGDGRKHYRFRFIGSGCVEPGEWSDVADALPGQDPAGGNPPEQPIRSVSLAVDESDGSVDIIVDGENTIGSIRWADSTSSFPDPGTGTIENTDENGDVIVTDAFSLASGETAHVTITAYFREDADGAPMDSMRVTASPGAGFDQPSDVQSFSGDVSEEDGVRLSWDSVPEDGIDYYEIREGADFANGDLVRRVAATETTLSPRFLGQELGSRSWTFHIKAVNVEGEASPNAASTGTLENPAPDATGLNPTASLSGLRIETDFTTAGSEATDFDLHASLSSGFSTGASNLRDSGEAPPLYVRPTDSSWAGETVFMRIVAKDSLTPYLNDEDETAEFSADMSLVDTPEVEPLIRQALGPIFRNGFESEEFGDWVDESGASVSADSDSWAGSQAGLFSSTASTSGSSGGDTVGAHIEIPEEIALAFAGKEVFINLYIKQPSSNAASEMAVAYSTADVGNSGWQTFSPDSGSWKRVSFTYQIPEPGSGGSDFLGILGDASGGGAATLVDQISITLSAGGGVATLDEITANEIAAGTITANEINAGTITSTEIQAESILAEDLDVNELSAIAVNAGTITAGLLQNQSGSVFLDLEASGNDSFIEHPALTLQADGDADFSGSLSAASGTFSGSLDAASGTFSGSLSAVDGSFTGNLTASVTQAQTMEIVEDLEGGLSEDVEVRLGADTLTFYDLTNDQRALWIRPEQNDRAVISPQGDLVLQPLTPTGRVYLDIGGGERAVARVNISSTDPGSVLREGTLHIQV